MNSFASKVQLGANHNGFAIGETTISVSNITETTLTLSWTAVPGATGYLVGRSGSDSNGNGAYQTIDGKTVTSRVFINLIPGTTYTVFVEPRAAGIRKTLTASTLATEQVTAERGPVSYANLAAARAALHTPADANYVMWDPAWPINRDIEDVFALELQDNDILVLPERTQPYIIDSSEGFRSSGVLSVNGRYEDLPIASRYKNLRPARTWFGMARARRGVLGLGPRAVIKMSDDTWTQEPQLKAKGAKMENNTYISPGRFWKNLSGVVQSELVGCQEKVLDAQHDSPYFGNFTMKSRDMGGVAFHAVSIGSGRNGIAERLELSGAWHGFLGIPNGEAGGITVRNNDNYLISKCILGTRDSTGFRTGTSPIMINSTMGGGRIEDVYSTETFAGMLTLWNCGGKHVLSNVNTRWTNPGVNAEKCQAGFELEWTGGSNWSNYNDNGGKPGKPADQGLYRNGLHISLNSPGGSAKITVRGVDLDRGPVAGALNVQSWGSDTLQTVDTIKCYDANGASIPVKVYGLA
jgi:hypothetical protein